MQALATAHDFFTTFKDVERVGVLGFRGQEWCRMVKCQGYSNPCCTFFDKLAEANFGMRAEILVFFLGIFVILARTIRSRARG